MEYYNPNWLSLILDKLEAIENQLSELKKEDKEKDGLEKWKTEKETQELLNLKATSLWRLRNNGEIEYTKVGNKTYYSYQSILDFLEKNAQKVFNI